MDVVHHDHVCPHPRLATEDFAIRHDVLAVAARDGRDVGMGPGRDVHGIRSLFQHQGRRGLHGEPDPHGELAHLRNEKADDAGVLGTGRPAAIRAASSPATPPPTTTTVLGFVAGGTSPSSPSRPAAGFWTHVTGFPW